jgi:hypothetical protein
MREKFAFGVSLLVVPVVVEHFLGETVANQKRCLNKVYVHRPMHAYTQVDIEFTIFIKRLLTKLTHFMDLSPS